MTIKTRLEYAILASSIGKGVFVQKVSPAHNRSPKRLATRFAYTLFEYVPDIEGVTLGSFPTLDTLPLGFDSGIKPKTNYISRIVSGMYAILKD